MVSVLFPERHTYVVLYRERVTSWHRLDSRTLSACWWEDVCLGVAKLAIFVPSVAKMLARSLASWFRCMHVYRTL